MKKTRVWKTTDGWAFLPFAVAQDEKLSLQAKGLAAVISMNCMTLGEAAVTKIELWRTITDALGMQAYYELVEAGYLNDFWGEPR